MYEYTYFVLDIKPQRKDEGISYSWDFDWYESKVDQMIVDWLNQKSSEGWELVQIRPTWRYSVTGYFRREKAKVPKKPFRNSLSPRPPLTGY